VYLHVRYRDIEYLDVKLLDVKLNSESGVVVAYRTLLAPITWGTTYVTITELLPEDRPLMIALARVGPAGLMLVGAGWWRSRWRPGRSELVQLAVLSMLNFGIFFPLLIVAIYRLPGGVAAAVGGVQPLLVGLIAWAVTGRRLRRLDAMLGVASAVGVSLVVVSPGAGIDSLGVVAALGANVSFSIGVVATKRFPTPPDRIGATGYQLLITSLVIAPLMVVFEGAPPAMTAVNLAGLAYLSLVATGFAFVVWFSGIRSLPTQAPPVLGLAAPITGAILGWALLGENLTPVQLTGFTITVSAIAYAATVGSRQPRVGHLDLTVEAPAARVGNSISPGWSFSNRRRSATPSARAFISRLKSMAAVSSSGNTSARRLSFARGSRPRYRSR
jgi:probable blue pigment (indigoidine) exporter